MNKMENNAETPELLPHCLAHGIPYWSRVSPRTIASPIDRLPYLAGLIEHLAPIDRTLRVLEIGSYAGASAVVMGKALQKHHDGKARLYCVDPWFHPPYASCDFNSERLFRHNIAASGVDDLVVSIKGFSRDILPLLKPESFDLAYVDGDHSRHGAALDIRACMELLRDGGYLCGDDLELQHEEFNGLEVPENGSVAVINGTACHPGVTLAVRDVFGRRISAVDGFWAQRKTDGWQDVKFTRPNPDWITPLFSMQHESTARLLLRRIQKEQWTNVVLYGAGKHTQTLLPWLLKSAFLSVNICGIVDDAKTQGALCGIPLVSRDILSEKNIDAIIISSDAHENVLAEKAASWGGGIPVCRIYKP
ncbi:MAG: class I SAM-dependent methyltransferase [Kiritimatiellae bacterium]|nr:class I SAM-dependent methyltransferase [Kiritimatiellia bacterium]MDD4735643.1 class I SAM-dependent methyltransferase [Kiritimatiellia bacterium]